MGPTEQRISTSQSMLSSPKAAIRNNRPKFRFGPVPALPFISTDVPS